MGTEEAGELVEPNGGFAVPSNRCAAAVHGSGVPRRPIMRVQSPLCYRSMFAGGDSEEDFAAWKAPRLPPQGLTRYRCTGCLVNDSFTSLVGLFGMGWQSN